MEDSVPADLGAWLRELRSRRGLTIAQVREALGLRRATAYVWETPAGRPEPADLQRLLELYGADDDEQLLAWRLRAGAAPDVAATSGAA